jgi:uncharacterized protein involved in cysteine biosynthesis
MTPGVRVLQPIIRAFEQLQDPELAGALWRSLLLSAIAFFGLIVLSVWGLHHLLAAHGILAWLAGILGGLLAAISALWLYIPLVFVIAGLFMEPICRAVEASWYPTLPPPAGASIAAQSWDGLVLGIRVLGLNLLSLILALLIPGIGLFLGFAITAWALGRGMFVSVAMRRMTRADAEARYREQRGTVLFQGAALALVANLPIANLLLPVIGPATMVHVLQSARHKSESWG